MHEKKLRFVAPIPSFWTDATRCWTLRQVMNQRQQQQEASVTTSIERLVRARWSFPYQMAIWTWMSRTTGWPSRAVAGLRIAVVGDAVTQQGHCDECRLATVKYGFSQPVPLDAIVACPYSFPPRCGRPCLDCAGYLSAFSTCHCAFIPDPARSGYPCGVYQLGGDREQPSWVACSGLASVREQR